MSGQTLFAASQWPERIGRPVAVSNPTSRVLWVPLSRWSRFSAPRPRYGSASPAKSASERSGTRPASSALATTGTAARRALTAGESEALIDAIAEEFADAIFADLAGDLETLRAIPRPGLTVRRKARAK